MVEQQGPADSSDNWLAALNTQFRTDPDVTTEALGFIASVHEETTGPFSSVDK